MKKLSLLALLAFFIPKIVFGSVTVPWQTDNVTNGWIYPQMVNSTLQSISVGTTTSQGRVTIQQVSSGRILNLSTGSTDSFNDMTVPSNEGFRIYPGDVSGYGFHGPGFQLWGDSSSFKGIVFDAGTVTGSDIVFRKSSNSGGVAMTIQQGTGNVGIGATTSPGTLLGIGNTGGVNFTSTGTTTFGSSVNGINITNGCFAVGGTCVTGGGSGTNYFTNSGITTTLNTGSVLSSGNYVGTSTATSTFAGPITEQGWALATSTVVCRTPQVCQYPTNGVADDVVINKAITDVNTAGGGKVLIKAGVYNIQTGGHIDLKSNIMLEGEGPGTLIMATSSGTADGPIGISASSTTAGVPLTNIILENLRIDGIRGSNNSYNTERDLWINDTQNMLVSGITIQNSKGFGIYITSNLATTSNIVINGNSTFSCLGNQDCIGGGPIHFSSPPTQDIVISGNSMYQTIQSGRTGIDVDTDINCADMVAVVGVQFQNNNCHGQFIFGEEKYPNSFSQISGNTMFPPYGTPLISSGIVILQRNNPVYATSTPRQVILTGNTINGGIILIECNSTNPCRNYQITNNTVFTGPASSQNQDFVGQSAINASWLTDSYIGQNHLYANASSTTGVLLQNSTNTRVEGGTIEDFSVGVDGGSSSNGNSLGPINLINDTTQVKNISNILTLNPSGLVGIGTSTPTSQLTIQQAGSGQILNLSSAGGSDNFNDVVVPGNQGFRLYPGNSTGYGFGGPGFQLWGDTSSFKGIIFDAGTVTGSDIVFRKSSNSGGTALTVQQGTGNVGVGATSSPGTLLSIGNTGGVNFTSSGTTTQGSSVNGINITNGCFAIAGTCVGSSGGGSGTVNSGVFGQAAYYGANGTAVSGTSTLVIGTTTTDANNVGIGTTSPWAQLSVNPNGIGSGPAFAVGSSTKSDLVITNAGNVGIGNSSPTQKLTVGPNIANSTQIASFSDTTSFPSVIFGSSASRYGALTWDNIAGSFNFQTFSRAFPIIFDASDARFDAGGNEIMRVASNGNVGIGTTTPYAALSVVGSSGVVADHYTATSTTATSTFAYTIQSPCFSTDGNTCLTSGSGTNAWVLSGTNLFPGSGVLKVQAPSFAATSTTATSTIGNAGMQFGVTTPTAGYDGQADFIATRTYGSSSNAQVKEGQVDIDCTLNTRLCLNIGSGSGGGSAQSPEMVLIGQQSTSATGIILKLKTSSTQFSGNLMISAEGKQAPAIELNEDIWNGGTNQAGGGLYQMTSHNNTYTIDGRNDANNGYCQQFSLSSDFSTTTSGAVTFFPCLNAAGSTELGTGRVNIFGTSTVSSIFNLTSLHGATQGNLFTVQEVGNVGIGTTSPYATTSIQSNSNVGDAFVIATSTGAGVFGVDNDGHQFTSGPAPVISACGTGTGTVVGDDQSGTITTATAATACTMTFSKAYRNTPSCTVTDNSLVGFADISTISTTAVTFGISSALTGGNLYYNCQYHK